MRIMVMGGAGFIGSHLVDRLLAEGHSVDVVDDLSSGSLANLGDARAATQRSGGELKIHHLDATSADAVSLVGMRRPDVIFHLALLPRVDRSNRAQALGFGAALTMLEAARQHAIAKVVVVVPAGSLYGHPAARALPVKEGDLIPRGVRGVVARSIVDLLVHYREQHMVEFTALAAASIYGPRQRPDGGVVSAFRAASIAGRAPTIEGTGRQTRDFLYIDDAVDACVRSVDRGSGLVINIGTGQQTSIGDLWKQFDINGDVVPTAAPARPDEMARFAVSPVRARIHLAWSPWTALDTGIGRLRTDG